MSDTQSPGLAARDTKGEDTLAWALAVSPVAATAILVLLLLVGFVFDLRWLSVLTLLAAAVLVVADKRRLVAWGRVAWGDLPATAWFLVPPVYLWKRATRLGRSKSHCWTWLTCAAVAFIAQTALMVAIATELADRRVAAQRLPDCASPTIVADVRGVFDSLPVVRQAGVKAVSLSEPEEVAQGPGSVPTARYCSGMMLASDTVEYAIDYSFERRQEQVIIRLQLRPGQ